MATTKRTRKREPGKITLVKSAEPAPASIEHVIRSRAYELFEQRGRAHGRDLDDWLMAEAEVRGHAKLASA